MDKIDSDFRNTCKVLFGEEIGALSDFAPYLAETLFPYKTARSCVSGKQVALSSPHYPEEAKYISQGEENLLKFPPLSINDIKDIDSLFEAASERAAYCGSKLFGSNLGVSDVDNGADCINVIHSHDVYSVKNAAYCSIGRYSDSIYGVSGFVGASHSMRCVWNAGSERFGISRCFETYGSVSTSGSYFVSNCKGCTNCMFSFNLRGKSNCIGNMQLSGERYAELKAKLVSEMAEKLKKDKRLFSIAQILPAESKAKEEEPPEIADSPPSVKKAFLGACRVVLGKEIGAPEKYAAWLLERALPTRKVKGKFGSPTYRPALPILGSIPAKNLATLDEALVSSKSHIEIGEGETPSLGEIAKRAGKIAVFTCEKFEGNCLEISETPAVVDSVSIHRMWYSLSSSLSGFCTLATESKYVFGGYYRTLNCEFCINPYNLTQCKSCFETDGSYQCRSCYFCHNCENLEEGILCFNMKGGRYAVLNQQLPKEEYLRIKKMLLDYVNGELERKGKLERSVFALSQPKGKK